MLTGLTHATDGDASLFGMSVRKDMSRLHSMMGVCPQHDILWGQLTAQEHLEMFYLLKGVPPTGIQAEVASRLEQVSLFKHKDERVGGFSGGMKRRLSISIVLIGDPKVVFLDKPTTGMVRNSPW